MAHKSALTPKQIGALTIGAIGVVYGDIGTSPLYAFREALGQSSTGGIDRSEILGVLSLAIWALILVVTLKYVIFLLRMDNKGEGGVLSLMALSRRATAGWTVVIVLGAIGAAMFYGDALLTPALSVLSAVEGLKTVPGIGASMSEGMIIAISMAILAGLFAIQSRGTSSVSKLFGPVCMCWFIAIAAIGVLNLVKSPDVLVAFNPAYAVRFMFAHGVTSLFVLGAVFLAVTGAEALTADMGHFGRSPIQIGWFSLVFPALTLNYLGQGAFAMKALEAALASGTTFENADWFFLMTPESLRLAMVILAACATIIASQAVITGAFSLTQQAISLGLLPRMSITRTSESQAGQIYIGAVNWLLLAGVIILILQFRSSSALAAAYGISVSGTMLVTSCLAFIVLWKRWKWPFWASVLLVLPFLLLDAFFFGANVLRVAEGGWVPLAIAALILMMIYIWLKGRAFLNSAERREQVTTKELAGVLRTNGPLRVPGTAVFLTAHPETAPIALLHNIKHNRVLHEQNIILKVRMSNSPRIAPEGRLTVEKLDDRFQIATLHYGYMETPDVPSDLFGSGVLQAGRHGASFFIGRDVLRASRQVGLPFWQDPIFIFLQRNAADPTDYFRIPPNRVVELGTRVEI